jgi:7-carboxy-7-deazaguanine synthase (Cx14CxxC type)
MTYAVKEIYYTLQGEGTHAGRPAVFLRFAGCNLWTGLEKDRANGPGGCSMWCDTDFVGTDGIGGGKYRDASKLAIAVERCWPTGLSGSARRFVVCTGGEPLLQLDSKLLDALTTIGFDVAAETNGTQVVPDGRLWLTVSPKANAPLRVTKGNELKLVFPQAGMDPELFAALEFDHFLLQPMDGPERVANTAKALSYCLKNPQWRLSLQTHKILRIP